MVQELFDELPSRNGSIEEEMWLTKHWCIRGACPDVIEDCCRFIASYDRNSTSF
jgi:hypothetical protein